MSRAHPHTKILAEAAREGLAPIGLRQRGRSRTWIDDRTTWLGVVEFQPSSRNRGSYLNVGITWLWHAYERDDPFLFFDVSSRIGGFVEYESDKQFRSAAESLARSAVKRVRELRVSFSTNAAVIEWLRKQPRYASRSHDLGCALALEGDFPGALRAFKHCAGARVEVAWEQAIRDRAVEYLTCTDADDLGERVRGRIDEARLGLGLESTSADGR